MKQTLLVSDVRHFGVIPINAYEDAHIQPDPLATTKEFNRFVDAYRDAGFLVQKVPSPEPDAYGRGAQDGVYVANWCVTHQGKAYMSNLPRGRREIEGPYSEKTMSILGFDVIKSKYLFSGQGDFLIVNRHVAIMGYGYRTDKRMANELQAATGLHVIAIQAKPIRWFGFGPRKRVRYTGLFDSYAYDIDLCVAVIDEYTLAVCLDALTNSSRQKLQKECQIEGIKIIPVSLEEARHAFACNLVSTGTDIVMAAGAPDLMAELKNFGKRVHTHPNDELKKGGGGVRCISLNLRYE